MQNSGFSRTITFVRNAASFPVARIATLLGLPALSRASIAGTGYAIVPTSGGSAVTALDGARQRPILIAKDGNRMIRNAVLLALITWTLTFLTFLIMLAPAGMLAGFLPFASSI